MADGKTYNPLYAGDRLGKQLMDVWSLMHNGRWWTLTDLQAECKARWGRNHTTQAISARVRDFRKSKYGSHEVPTRRRPSVSPERGLWEYRLVINRSSKQAAS